MESERPTMHCHGELLEDLGYDGFLPDATLWKWFRDGYSTSKHLLTLYNLVIGLGAKRVVEIGFGRSSFVLAKAIAETDGHLICCDVRDFSYLLNSEERKKVTFVKGKSDEVWDLVADEGIDFAFLDYFSGENIPNSFIKKEIKTCLSYTKTNGIIAVHDSYVKKYHVGSALRSIGRPWFNSDVEVISLPYNYGLGLLRNRGSSDYGILEDGHSKKPDGEPMNHIG